MSELYEALRICANELHAERNLIRAEKQKAQRCYEALVARELRLDRVLALLAQARGVE